MPKRDWDHPAAKAVPLQGNHAKKRSLSEIEDIDDVSMPINARSLPETKPPPVPTPQVSPDAMQGTGTTPINPLIDPSSAAHTHWVPHDDDNMAMEAKMEDALSDTTNAQASQTTGQPGSSSKRKRRLEGSTSTTPPTQRPDNNGTSAFTEIFDRDPWVDRLGLGWTTTEGDGHERGIWQSFKQVVNQRFLLSQVKFLAKNRNQEMCLASSNEGWCFFNGKLDRCWRVAFNEEEALERMRQCHVNASNCVELRKTHDPESASRSSILVERVSGAPHLASPPDGWVGFAHMNRLDGVHGSILPAATLSTPATSKMTKSSPDHDTHEHHGVPETMADEMEID